LRIFENTIEFSKRKADSEIVRPKMKQHNKIQTCGLFPLMRSHAMSVSPQAASPQAVLLYPQASAGRTPRANYHRRTRHLSSSLLAASAHNLKGIKMSKIMSGIITCIFSGICLAAVGGTYEFATSPANNYTYVYGSADGLLFAVGGIWQTQLLNASGEPMPRRRLPVTNVQHCDCNMYYNCLFDVPIYKAYNVWGEWGKIGQSNGGRTNDAGVIQTGFFYALNPKYYNINCDASSGNCAVPVAGTDVLLVQDHNTYYNASYVSADLTYRAWYQQSRDSISMTLSVLYGGLNGSSSGWFSFGGPDCAQRSMNLRQVDSKDLYLADAVNYTPVSSPPYCYPLNSASGWSVWTPDGYVARTTWDVDILLPTDSLADTAPYVLITDINSNGYYVTKKLASYDKDGQLIDWLAIDFYRTSTKWVSDYVVFIDPQSLSRRGRQVEPAYGNYFDVILAKFGGSLAIEDLPNGREDSRFNLVDYAILNNIYDADLTDIYSFCKKYLEDR